MRNIVINTNVFVAALRSSRGASYKLISLAGQGKYVPCLSVPLVLEYEDAAKRMVGSGIALSNQDIDDIIDYLCSVAQHHEVYYLWRPWLKDADDDMVLELAVTANAHFIVTYNISDFRGAEHFGVQVITPKTFLEGIGGL